MKLGLLLGFSEGIEDGALLEEGFDEGTLEGFDEGCSLGEVVVDGTFDGRFDGSSELSVGWSDGADEGGHFFVLIQCVDNVQRVKCCLVRCIIFSLTEYCRQTESHIKLTTSSWVS